MNALTHIQPASRQSRDGASTNTTLIRCGVGDSARAVPLLTGEAAHRRAFNDFIDACECKNLAESREAASDAAAVARIARHLDTFLIRAAAELEGRSNLWVAVPLNGVRVTQPFDPENFRARIIDTVSDELPPEAATLLQVDLAQ